MTILCLWFFSCLSQSFVAVWELRNVGQGLIWVLGRSPQLWECSRFPVIPANYSHGQHQDSPWWASDQESFQPACIQPVRLPNSAPHTHVKKPLERLDDWGGVCSRRRVEAAPSQTSVNLTDEVMGTLKTVIKTKCLGSGPTPGSDI